MRVLVIGGTGYIASVLVRRLWADGHDVTIVHRGASRDDLPHDVERLRADRSMTADLGRVLSGRRFDVVYDMIAFDDGAVRQVYDLLGAKMGRYVLLSTGLVYAPRPRGILREDDPLGPLEDYGRRKLDAERVVHGRASPRRPAVIIRGNETIGPRDSIGRRFAHLPQRVRHGLPIIVPGRLATRGNYGYVEDLARLLAIAGTSPVHGPVAIYNAGGAVHSFADYLAALFAAAGRRVPVRELGFNFDAYLSWTGRRDVEWHLNVFGDGVMDNARARTELGWEPRVPFALAVARHFNWLRRFRPDIAEALPEDAATAARHAEAGHEAEIAEVPPIADPASDPWFGDDLDRSDHVPVAGPEDDRAASLRAPDIALLGALQAARVPITEEALAAQACELVRASGAAPPDRVVLETERTLAAALTSGLVERIQDPSGASDPPASKIRLSATGYLALLGAVSRAPSLPEGTPLPELLARFFVLSRFTYLRWLAEDRPASDLIEVGDAIAEPSPPPPLPDGVLARCSSFDAFARYFHAAIDADALLSRWMGAVRRSQARLAAEREALMVESRAIAATIAVEPAAAAERLHAFFVAGADGRPPEVFWAKRAEIERRTRVEPALAALSATGRLIGDLRSLLEAARGEAPDAAIAGLPVRSSEPSLAHSASPFVEPSPAAEPAAAAGAPREGDLAPDFVALSTAGEVRLSGLRGQWVVLYFYPMDDTPGCTAESCQFRDDHGAFEVMQAKLLGVSTDGIESHAAFREKYGLPFQLVSDVDRSIARRYGVLDEPRGWAERVTFVIRPDGRIARILRVHEIDGHSRAVLAALTQAAIA